MYNEIQLSEYSLNELTFVTSTLKEEAEPVAPFMPPPTNSPSRVTASMISNTLD